MPTTVVRTPALRVLRPHQGNIMSVMGVLVNVKVSTSENQNQLALAEGKVTPGALVPLHTHPYLEVFYVLEGELEILGMAEGRDTAETLRPGDCVNVPSNAIHGFRNTSGKVARCLVLCTDKRLEGFWGEAGTRADVSSDVQLPSREEIGRAIQISRKYGMEFLPPKN